jgi:hypothetical protein
MVYRFRYTLLSFSAFHSAFHDAAIVTPLLLNPHTPDDFLTIAGCLLQHLLKIMIGCKK